MNDFITARQRTHFTIMQRVKYFLRGLFHANTRTERN